MNLGKVEIWETSLDRIVTLREGAKGVLRPICLPAADSSGQIHGLLVRNCLESPNLSRCHSVIDR